MGDGAKQLAEQKHQSIVNQVTSGLVSLSVDKHVDNDEAAAAHVQTPSRPVRWATHVRSMSMRGWRVILV